MPELSTEAALIEMQSEIQKLMNDLETRINKVYDKYTENKKIPKLPEYSKLKDHKVRYACSLKLTESIDELNDLKLRVGTLYRYLSRSQNYQPTSKTNYNVVQSFKLSVKSNLDTLDQYRFELADLIKNANNKLRVLDSVQFYEFD